MTSDNLKRKLAAVLSADVQGYSMLMGEDEEGTIRTLKSFLEVISGFIQQHRGRIVTTGGDSVLADFASVVDATRCAVEIQKKLKEKNQEVAETQRMEFRIGVNLGDVVEEGDTILGDGVNIAARVQSLAYAGGICITGTAYDQIKNKLAFGYEYMGEQTVKNIKDPVKIYRVLMEPGIVGKRGGEKKTNTRQWQIVTMGLVIAGIVIAASIVTWKFYIPSTSRPRVTAKEEVTAALSKKQAILNQPLSTSSIEPAPQEKKIFQSSEKVTQPAQPPPSQIEVASKEKMVFPLPGKPSIAVLPFANMTGDTAQEFLVDGLTENIITALARMPQLFVIARNSTFVYKGKGVKVQQVAEELGIQYVLEGSLQRSGDKVRVTTQFIDAVKGHHLWAGQYDRELKNFFKLTDEVTRKVLQAVNIKLTGREETQLRRRKDPKNTETLLRTFEVVAAMRGLNPKDNAQAKHLAEELTVLDPGWSGGFTLLARAHYMDFVLGVSSSPKESLAKALELAKKAVAMDKFNPTNYDTLGYVYTLMGEHERALVEFEKGSTLCPSCSDPYMYMGHAFYCLDETDKAIASLQTALRLNPYAPAYYYLHLGNAYRHAGIYLEAIAGYKKALKISPNAQLGYIGLVSAYSLLGQEGEARSSAQELLRLNPKFSVNTWEKTTPYKNQEKLSLFANALRRAGLK